MHTTLLAWDYAAFVFLNGFAGMSPLSDAFLRFFADGIIVLLIAGLALFVLQKKERARYRACIEALVSGFIIGRVVIVSLIRAFFWRERPFVEFQVNQLLAHNPLDASYPSSHATMMFAIAFSVLFVNRRWGIVYLVLALASALSRVVVGVHFPLDILAGFWVGLLSALIVHFGSRHIR